MFWRLPTPTKRTERSYWVRCLPGFGDQALPEDESELGSPPVLNWYDPTADTKITADTSCYGLRAVLLQKQNGEWKPAAYASRSLTETETLTVVCPDRERVLGHNMSMWTLLQLLARVESHHWDRPQAPHPLLNTKHLDSLPPRVLRFRFCLASYSVEHVPGKVLYTADTLSRAPL